MSTASTSVSKIVPPFWVVQRQIKFEALDEHLLRLSGPNLPEMFLGIRKGDNGQWGAYVRSERDGADLDVCEPKFEQELDAWYVGFEMYRVRVIV
jgi:hypothetical protein